jgi:hypothetical protein
MEEAPNMAMAAVTNTDMALATAMPVRRRAGSLATISNTAASKPARSGVGMKKSIGVDALLGGAIVGLFIAMRSAAATEPTSATLTPEITKEIARVEAEIDRIEAQTLDRHWPSLLIGSDARPCDPELQ